MSLLATLPAAIVETILIRIAALFLAGAKGDTAAAREAAIYMLDAHHAQTLDELRLAANTIAFSFQALEALAQSATPDMSLTRILRLRGSAVSLNRESAKAERRLEQLRTARQQAVPAEPQPEPVAIAPKIEKAVTLIRETAEIADAAKAANQTWDQANAQRRTEARLAHSLLTAHARAAA